MAAFLFPKKTKSPQEIAKSCREALLICDKGKDTKAIDKALEELNKAVLAMKNIFNGGETPDNPVGEPNQELIGQLSTEIYNNDLIALLVSNLLKFEFETRKDVVWVFNFIVRRQVGTRYPTVEYITVRHPEMLEQLCVGYESPDIALNCGSMLRECLRHEQLAKILINSENFNKFFTYVEMSNFDVASDAFTTFKDLLTKHKPLCAEFMEKNYDKLFEAYLTLLNSTNYVTKRQSLKLLGELLLDRANFNIMTKYISNQDNLKLMMNLLRDKSRNIQFEAFHVFKVFVANPNKPKPILDILMKNKDRLIAFLSTFQPDREDEQFTDEKQFLLSKIQQLTE